MQGGWKGYEDGHYYPNCDNYCYHNYHNWSSMVEWIDEWMDDLIMKIRKTENCRKFSLKNGSKRAKINVFWPKIAVF